MPHFSITVVEADGRRVPIEVVSDDLRSVCRQALDKARALAVDGGSFSDPRRCIRVTDSSDRLVFRIAIDRSLIPTAQ